GSSDLSTICSDNTCVPERTHTCPSAKTGTLEHTHTHTQTHIHTHIHTHIYTNTNTHTPTHTERHRDTHTHTHISQLASPNHMDLVSLSAVGAAEACYPISFC